jgi:arylsulfatase A-like enzyme
LTQEPPETTLLEATPLSSCGWPPQTVFDHLFIVRGAHAILLLGLFTLTQLAPAAERPNIIFFLVDDMGWQETSVPFHTQVTELNRRYRTPNMEKLAAEGVKFTQAYASAVCSPSRISALTGMNAARHGVTNWTLQRDRGPDGKHPTLALPEWPLSGFSPSPATPRSVSGTPLPQLLRTAGYRTIHIGKAHFGAIRTPGEYPLSLGFDINVAGHAAGGPGSFLGDKNFSGKWRGAEAHWDVPGLEAYHGKEVYLTEALTLEAVKAIEQSVADRKPFYLYMSHYAVHAPREKDARFYQKYIDQGLKPAEATLASMVEGMDKSLGDLRGALQRLGVAANTLIVFLSDNGAPANSPPNLPLRGHKLNPYEGGVRVPMMVYWPGVTAPGTTNPTPVVIDDIFPTLLEIGNVAWQDKVSQTVDGISLAPELRKPGTLDNSRPIVWHFPNNYSGQGPFSAMRAGCWKLIYFHAAQKYELYNLDADIGEKVNLADKEPARTTTLARQLGQLLRTRGALMPTVIKTGQLVPYSGF